MEDAAPVTNGELTKINIWNVMICNGGMRETIQASRFAISGLLTWAPHPHTRSKHKAKRDLKRDPESLQQ